jgi:protein-S-isoprenylcysteine O-methyltransferase Ste14
MLVTKATVEERWMLAAHPGYAAYRERTRRFLPGIF